MGRYSKSRTLPERALSEETQVANEHAKLFGETNDCGVRAISILTELPYVDVLDAFDFAGRESRRGVNGWETSIALNQLGFKIEPLGPLHYRHAKWRKLGRKTPQWVLDITSQYPGHHKECAGLTTYHPHRFPEVWAKLPPLLLEARAHYAAFKNGVVHDWSANKPLQILGAYRVEKLNEHDRSVEPDR